MLSRCPADSYTSPAAILPFLDNEAQLAGNPRPYLRPANTSDRLKIVVGA
jgi:hypothetical protein